VSEEERKIPILPGSRGMKGVGRKEKREKSLGKKEKRGEGEEILQKKKT